MRKAPNIKILLEHNPSMEQFSYCITVNGTAPKYHKGTELLVDFLEQFLDCYYTNGASPHLKLAGQVDKGVREIDEPRM